MVSARRPPRRSARPGGSWGLAALAVAWLALPSIAAAQSVHGDLRIRAPGVVHVSGYVIHLLGVRALGSIGISQYRQEGLGEDLCPDGKGGVYQCGLIGMAKAAETTVGYAYTCEVQQFEGDVRNWGICRPYSTREREAIPDVPSLNQQWVQLGWAEADTSHTDMWVPYEEEARAAGSGMWAYPPVEIDRQMPDHVAGAAKVLDGNTLHIDGYDIRLYGADAPELNQSCSVVVGNLNASYGCGGQVRAQMIYRTMGKRVYCAREDVEGDVNWARCWEANAAGDGPAEGAVSLNEQMVRDGWARAERRIASEFIDLDLDANRQDIGLHAGTHVSPSNWRRGRR